MERYTDLNAIDAEPYRTLNPPHRGGPVRWSETTTVQRSLAVGIYQPHPHDTLNEWLVFAR